MRIPNLLFFLFILTSVCVTAQDKNILPEDSLAEPTPADKKYSHLEHQRDLIDALEKLYHKKSILRRDTVPLKAGKLYVSAAPSAGYTLATRWAGIIVGNAAFYTSDQPGIKLSNLYASTYYTQNKQFVVHMQNSIWTKGNRYNIITDWRYLHYVQKTYGLGDNTVSDNFVNQSYTYVRLYQTILRTLATNLYAGMGYSFDDHYNITPEEGSNAEVLAGLNKYGITENSISAGLNFNVLYDSRLNSINPQKGTYLNIVYRSNRQALGSNHNWESIMVDARKFIRLPKRSENVLALWSFNWFTPSGVVPYLDLPSTGWDPYNNTGRGYIQGRFRGRNMVYLESEYRFKITRKGLLGGVVFANTQVFSEMASPQFEKILPGAGCGLRLKFNKFSRTNIAIDYGFGLGGSQGVFLNLGECF